MASRVLTVGEGWELIRTDVSILAGDFCQLSEAEQEL
jgi:hypothetical protein